MMSLEALIHRLKSLLLEETVPSAGGTLQIVVTGTPTSLGSQKCRMVTIKSDSGNTDNVYVGFSADLSDANGFPIEPGECIDIVVNDLSKVYVMSPGVAQKVYVMWVR